MKKIILYKNRIYQTIFFLFLLFCLVLVDSNYKSVYAKETIQYDNIYDAYYAKCMEIVTKYGRGTIVTNNSDNSDDYAYLKGLCAVNLIDYDQNHIDDLFLIYTKNDLHTLPDNDEIPFPSSTDYVVEIWSYDNHSLHLSYKNEFVSAMSSIFQYSSYFTMYENEEGFPVLQFYKETYNSIQYKNAHYNGHNWQTDILTYDTTGYSYNNAHISQTVWDKKVNGYNKILFHSFLSNSNYSENELEEWYNIQIEDTLTQTEIVLKALEEGNISRFKIVEENYLSIYEQILDQKRREICDIEKDYGGATLLQLQYALYDINNDSIPELIINMESCEADSTYFFYTIEEGAIEKCGELSASHSSLYINNHKNLIQYSGHMSHYIITQISMDGSKLITKEIDNDTNKPYEIDGEFYIDDYPELEEYGYGDYDEKLVFSNQSIPTFFYNYKASYHSIPAMNNEYYTQWDGNIYFRQYSDKSMDEGALFANYSPNHDENVPKDIMCMDSDGNITKVGKDYGRDVIFILNEKIYSTGRFSDETVIYSSDLTGENINTYENLFDIYDTYNDIIICQTKKWGIAVIDSKTGKEKTLVEYEDEHISYLGCDDKYIYYYLNQSNEELLLYKMTYDGDSTLLTKIIIESINPAYYIPDFQIVDDYLFFNVGYDDGSGSYYQGGNIYQLKKDGTEKEVIYKQYFQEYNDPSFYVYKTNSGHYEIKERSSQGICQMDDNGDIYIYPDETNIKYILLTKNEYYTLGHGNQDTMEDKKIWTIDNMEYINGKFFFTIHIGIYNDEESIGWRDYYTRLESYDYCKDLSTQEITLLNQYGPNIKRTISQ